MNKNILIGSSLIVVFLSVGMLSGYFIPKTNQTQQAQYDTLLSDFQELNAEFDELLNKYTILSGNYNDTMDEYNELMINYNNLEGDYDDLYDLYEQLLSLCYSLEQSYYRMVDIIKQATLPAQYMIFAEAVRRYYFEDYYVGLATDDSTYWYQYVRFCRDVILHDSQTDASLYGSWFPEVSNALADCLRYRNSTELLAWDIFTDVLYPYEIWEGLWGTEWDYWSWNEIEALEEYDYICDVLVECDYLKMDYIQFPVEAAFRTRGGYVDQAMFCAALLESCGFETALAIIHDTENPHLHYYGITHHGTLLVHIEDTELFQYLYPSCHLWNFGSLDPYLGSTWVWIDPYFDNPFGFTPDWLQYYVDTWITHEDMYNDVTIALCDFDGAISL